MIMLACVCEGAVIALLTFTALTLDSSRVRPGVVLELRLVVLNICRDLFMCARKNNAGGHLDSSMVLS